MKYHHGDLPRALLDALPEAITAHGLEGFSLRDVARRAGVTHGAPAHHFGDKRGLLTAFAIEGAHLLADAVTQAVEQVPANAHPQRLTAVGLGYLEFALNHPAHFRVTFSPEGVDLGNMDLLQARGRAGGTLDTVLQAARDAGWLQHTDYADVRMASWALAHGYATLAADTFAAWPADEIRDQARSAFDHFTQRVLVASTD